MIKTSPRRDIVLGTLLMALGTGLAVFGTLAPKELLGLLRHHLPYAYWPMIAAGFGGILHAVGELAFGAPWGAGPSVVVRALGWLRTHHRPVVAVFRAQDL